VSVQFQNITIIVISCRDGISQGCCCGGLCRASNRVIPVITDDAGHVWLQKEKHLCRDMTASGGNVDLLMK